MASFLSKLFGKESPGQQLLVWQVGGQLVTSVAQPAFNLITQQINELIQTVPLSPADLADLVVRGFLTEGAASGVAKKSGVSPEDFALLVKDAGQALDTTSLIEAYRRKIIPWDAGHPDGVGVLQGIAQGHLDNKWAPVIQALGRIRPGVADAVDAAVEGQIPLADAQELARQQGVEPDDFTILYNTRGNPPDPTSLAAMVHRGVIPLKGTGPNVLSFEQGISEGATKDKWIPAMEGIMTVIPPEATIRALLSNGAIDDAAATALWAAHGYDPVIVAGFVKEAHQTKTTTDHALAKADVLKLYTDRAITTAQAVSLLGDLKYSPEVAAQILSVQDMHLAVTSYDAAVSRIRGYYIARKITQGDVVKALDSLGVPAASRDQVLTAWAIERDSNTRTLTEAQIVDAWFLTLIDDATATTMLQATGLTAWEAWLLMSIKAKQPAFAEPAKGPNPVAP
jgi:hypothetical protein